MSALPKWTIAATGATLLVTASPCRGQSQQAEAFLQERMARYHIPGLAAAVTQNGNLLFARGCGFANVENSNTATPDTVFLLGSLTKPFTAAAVLLLVEEQKIDLDQPAARYLKDLALPDHLQTVTVRQLLNHTSGIADFHDLPGSIQFARLDRLPREVVHDALALPLRFKPGEQFWYSGSNYILLGMIIERASGKRFGQFLAERIFQPLRLTATRMQNWRALVPGRAAGYNWVGSNWLNADFISPSHLYSAGGVLSTVLDLARWDQALFSGRVVKAASLSQMLDAPVLAGGGRAHYGLGLELLTDRGHRVAGHSGEIFGFNTTWYRYLDDKLTVIVLANEGDAPTEPLAKGLAGIFLGLPDRSYPSRTPIADPKPGFAQTLQALLEQAASGNVNASVFADSASSELVPFIERVGPTFLGTKGRPRTTELLEQVKEGDMLVLIYRTKFDHESLIWTVKLTPDGKIAGLEPAPE